METYWHRPVIVSETNARMGDVMGRMKVKTNHPDDDVIDNDLILVWGNHKRSLPMATYQLETCMARARSKTFGWPSPFFPLHLTRVLGYL
jgi:hypothetical protein